MIEKTNVTADTFLISEFGLLPDDVSAYPIGEVLGTGFIEGKGGVVWIKHHPNAANVLSLVCLATGGPYELLNDPDAAPWEHVGSFSASMKRGAVGYHVFASRPKPRLAS